MILEGNGILIVITIPRRQQRREYTILMEENNMSKTASTTKNLTKWPERKLSWKKVKSEAALKGQTITEYIVDTILQRIKRGW
jgi:hypothetical protein